MSKIKKMTFQELCTFANALPINKGFRFYLESDKSLEDCSIEESDCSNGWLFSYMDFADSTIVALGGFGNPTETCWIMNDSDKQEKELEIVNLFSNMSHIWSFNKMWELSSSGDFITYVREEVFDVNVVIN